MIFTEDTWLIHTKIQNLQTNIASETRTIISPKNCFLKYFDTPLQMISKATNICNPIDMKTDKANNIWITFVALTWKQIQSVSIKRSNTMNKYNLTCLLVVNSMLWCPQYFYYISNSRRMRIWCKVLWIYSLPDSLYQMYHRKTVASSYYFPVLLWRLLQPEQKVSYRKRMEIQEHCQPVRSLILTVYPQINMWKWWWCLWKYGINSAQKCN